MKTLELVSRPFILIRIFKELSDQYIRVLNFVIMPPLNLSEETLDLTELFCNQGLRFILALLRYSLELTHLQGFALASGCVQAA